MRKQFIAVFAFALSAAGLVRAENILFGQLIDDPGFTFDSFGNQRTLGTTRGANFGGTDVSWNGVILSSTSGANGISWVAASGTVTNALLYGYSGIYTGSSPGTAAAADNLTNSGIYGAGTSISISATSGYRYVIDLLFANALSGTADRIFDVSVGGVLYADDLLLKPQSSGDRRPLVYRFEVTAPVSNVINITFGGGPSGSGIDPTPYVNAMTVTVPEPSALSLIVVGLGGVIALRRGRRKADST